MLLCTVAVAVLYVAFPPCLCLAVSCFQRTGLDLALSLLAVAMLTFHRPNADLNVQVSPWWFTGKPSERTHTHACTNTPHFVKLFPVYCSDAGKGNKFRAVLQGNMMRYCCADDEAALSLQRKEGGGAKDSCQVSVMSPCFHVAAQRGLIGTYGRQAHAQAHVQALALAHAQAHA